MDGQKRALIYRTLWFAFSVITAVLVFCKQADSSIWFYVMSLFCLLRADIADLEE